MNETLLWLLYCLSGGVAFAGVYARQWQIVWALLAGGLVTAVGWMLIFQLTDEDKRPNWIKLDLSLNISFGLIFALIGAVSAWWLVSRQQAE